MFRVSSFKSPDNVRHETRHSKLPNSSLHRRYLVTAYMNERGLLQEGRADHQALLIGSADVLPTQSDERASYDFNPCAFGEVVAGLHHRIDRRHSLEGCYFFSWNRFRSHAADDAHDTRRLQHVKTPHQRKVGETIPGK